MILDFSGHLPAYWEFGAGRLQLLGEACSKYGHKALLVCGAGGSSKRNGSLARSQGYLKEAAVPWVLYDKAEPNPTLAQAAAGAELAIHHRCDVIVGLGGGSTIDCAKGIAMAAGTGSAGAKCLTGRTVVGTALPLIAVPTTCGTGSESNGIAVFTDEVKHCKRAFVQAGFLPAVSIIDPELLVSQPSEVLSSVVFDALCHHMEACISSHCQPFVEAYAAYSMKLFDGFFDRATRDSEDIEAWSALALVAAFGGLSINRAGTTAPHGLAHPIGGLCAVQHGRALAAVVPAVFRRSAAAAPERFAVLARILGGAQAEDCGKLAAELLARLELRTTLSQEGVALENVEALTRLALRYSRSELLLHPTLFAKEEIAEIYAECM